MIFETLTYLYKGTKNFQQDKTFYLEVLQAELIWEFSRFSTTVAAFKLGSCKHLVLLADHLEPEKIIFIYRTPNLSKAVKELEGRGLILIHSAFEIPDGRCILFEDQSNTVYGLYEPTKPRDFLIQEYQRQQGTKAL